MGHFQDEASGRGSCVPPPSSSATCGLVGQRAVPRARGPLPTRPLSAGAGAGAGARRPWAFPSPHCQGVGHSPVTCTAL